MIYCVIPRELEAELFDKMVEYYKDNPNVTVILDRREGRPARRPGARRAQGARETRDRRRPRVAGDVPGRPTHPSIDARRPTGRLRSPHGDGRNLRIPEPVHRRGDRVVPALDGAEDVDRAVATARAAWEEWRLVPAPERGNILFRFAQLLERSKPELSDLMTREMGKVKAEAGGDVQEAIDMSYYMGGEGRRLFGQTTPSELRDKFMMSVRMPVGVVGAITPWNFPIAIPAWKLCPALVCGNTVVLKPAEDTPLLAQRFVDLLHEAGLPEGVVQVVHGFGEEAGDALVRHPDVPVITFTGSRETGVLVTKARGRRAEARAPRARRQERDHRHGRRRPRPRGRRDRLVGVRHRGAALHGGVARDRPARRLRRAAVEARRARRGDAHRRAVGGRHRDRAR